MALSAEPLSIEPMRRTDLEAVLRIDKRCFPTPWLPGAFLTELSNRAACYMVARSGDELAGYGGVWVIMDEAHITTLAVAPEYQGRRIGERLLVALIEEAILQNASHITLEVRESNRIAQCLYRKYGFHEAAIRKSYYTDNGENAIVMWAVEINTQRYQQQFRARRQQIYPVLEPTPR
jgi:ribosomal-protein-alanine N-acetyltransferase